MSEGNLEVRGVDVQVDDHLILRNINLSVRTGEVHVLLGQNGSGKSSLLSAIMGLPPFNVTAGEVRYGGRDITGLSIDERARLGIGMAFQRPPALDGVTVAQFAAALDAGDLFDTEASTLDMAGFPNRDLMVGFSGGEIKRWEVLKLFLQQPDLVLLDEPESGVDLEHVAAVGAAVNRLVSEPGRDGSRRSALLITHTGLILDYVTAHKAHLMSEGSIVHSGDPQDLFGHVKASGYVAPTHHALQEDAR